MMFRRKIPTLVELCVQTTIDNLRYLGDVGETDLHLLKDILPHCTIDQLMHIEKCSKGRDLSSVTDSLWKKFYEQQFGVESNIPVERMNQKKASSKWRRKYEDKLKKLDQAKKESMDRMKQRYKKEDDRKQSRQIQLCTKVPPSSNKRNFYGGSSSFNGLSNSKGSLMKKARMEYLNSHEVKVHAAMRKNNLQRNQGAPHTIKPSGFLGKGSSSSSGLTKPSQRRF